MFIGHFSLAVYLIFFSSCKHGTKETYTEWSGDYIEEPAYPAKPAHVRIRQLDHSLFLSSSIQQKRVGLNMIVCYPVNLTCL
jgi:hypothetical protein